MTGFQECYEMGLGRTDAFNKVPFSEHWSEPRKASFLHWQRLFRKRSVLISYPPSFRTAALVAQQGPGSVEDQPSVGSGRKEAA